MLLISDGMNAVALSSPVEVSGDAIGNVEGISILDIERLECCSGSVNGTQESLEVEVGAISEGVRLDVVGDPTMSALSDLLHDLAVDWVLDCLGHGKDSANDY